jgi:hypothetical protein
MPRTYVRLAAVLSAVIAIAGGTAFAVASTSAPSAATSSTTTLLGCKNNRTHVLYLGRPCPRRFTAESWLASDANGSLTATWIPSLRPASIHTGGPFAANKTELGTLTLRPGTYLLNVNFKAKPDAATTANVFPSLFIYNGTALADFSNNLFNIGSGALENSSSDTIDSYFSGSGVVKVTSTETLHVYAFGYDSDQGAGTYTMEGASITVVRVG